MIVWCLVQCLRDSLGFGEVSGFRFMIVWWNSGCGDCGFQVKVSCSFSWGQVGSPRFEGLGPRYNSIIMKFQARKPQTLNRRQTLNLNPERHSRKKTVLSTPSRNPQSKTPDPTSRQNKSQASTKSCNARCCPEWGTKRRGPSHSGR